MTSYGYIIMIIVNSCIIWFLFDCIMQLKLSYYIATNVTSRKSATTFGDLPDCLREENGMVQVQNETVFSSNSLTLIFSFSVAFQANRCRRLSHFKAIRWFAQCITGRSMKTSKLRITSLCDWNPLVTGGFPSKRASSVENVSIWLRHHDMLAERQILYGCEVSETNMIVTSMMAGQSLIIW